MIGVINHILRTLRICPFYPPRIISICYPPISHIPSHPSICLSSKGKAQSLPQFFIRKQLAKLPLSSSRWMNFCWPTISPARHISLAPNMECAGFGPKFFESQKGSKHLLIATKTIDWLFPVKNGLPYSFNTVPFVVNISTYCILTISFIPFKIQKFLRAKQTKMCFLFPKSDRRG